MNHAPSSPARKDSEISKLSSLKRKNIKKP